MLPFFTFCSASTSTQLLFVASLSKILLKTAGVSDFLTKVSRNHQRFDTPCCFLNVSEFFPLRSGVFLEVLPFFSSPQFSNDSTFNISPCFIVASLFNFSFVLDDCVFFVKCLERFALICRSDACLTLCRCRLQSGPQKRRGAGLDLAERWKVFTERANNPDSESKLTHASGPLETILNFHLSPLLKVSLQIWKYCECSTDQFEAVVLFTLYSFI